MFTSPFYDELKAKVSALRGFHNAHLHIDRVNTFEHSVSNFHLSLAQKHRRITDLHQGPQYEDGFLSDRINAALDVMVACNTRRADSVVDVTTDGLGLRVLERTKDIQFRRKDEIDFRRAVYSPLGFKDTEPERWALFEQGVTLADFVGCLPERDERADYPDHIGYEECCRRMLDLARQYDMDVQIHVDQANHPDEDGTERLLNVIEAEGLSFGKVDAPKIWAVHMISPSCYAESRWNDLVNRLKASAVGVICCPSGALGMRQLRSVMTPTYNSIARVLELAAAGISVRLGSDNVADMLSPSTSADLTAEVFLLSAAHRFYDIDILAKLACGTPLSLQDRDRLKEHLHENDIQTAKAVQRWGAEAT